MDKRALQEQFGAHADSYIDSEPHARGASLRRLVELLRPQSEWHVLDVATAAGHTAFAFAPHVKQVWATDITDEMLAIASQQVRERDLDNVTTEFADAENLPYDDDRFDLVTCRIAPHHFGDVAPFMAEAFRVCRPGGAVAVVDNIVPDGPAGDFVNAFEKFRDPTHGRCLTMAEWLHAFQAIGFTMHHHETLLKPMVLEAWAARHDEQMQRYLKAMLSEVGAALAAFLRPQFRKDATVFHLREGLFIGRKPK